MEIGLITTPTKKTKMIYIAKDLLAHLTHLTLTATNGKIEWIGTYEAWQKVWKK